MDPRHVVLEGTADSDDGMTMIVICLNTAYGFHHVYLMMLLVSKALVAGNGGRWERNIY